MSITTHKIGTKNPPAAIIVSRKMRVERTPANYRSHGTRISMHAEGRPSASRSSTRPPRTFPDAPKTTGAEPWSGTRKEVYNLLFECRIFHRRFKPKRTEFRGPCRAEFPQPLIRNPFTKNENSRWIFRMGIVPEGRSCDDCKPPSALRAGTIQQSLPAYRTENS